jgi:hypothetical protein
MVIGTGTSTVSEPLCYSTRYLPVLMSYVAQRFTVLTPYVSALPVQYPARDGHVAGTPNMRTVCEKQKKMSCAFAGA